MTILGRTGNNPAPVPDEAVPEAGELPSPEPAPGPPAKPARWPFVAVVILAATAAVLALLGLEQHNARQAEREQNRQLREVSGQTVAALTSYDYQHLDVWKKAVLANLTGKFQSDFESSVSGFEQVYVAEHNRGTGTVEGVWVGQVAAGKATTVVLVQFTITSLTGTHTLRPYVQLTLLKVAGRWRVDDVQYTIDTGGASSTPGGHDGALTGTVTAASAPAAAGTYHPAPTIGEDGMGVADDDLDEDLLGEDADAAEDADGPDLEDLDEEDLDEVVLDDEPLDDEPLDDEVLDDEVLVDVDTVIAPPPPPPARDEDEDEDDEEEADSDDVEASLDVILKERLVVVDDEDDDDEESADGDDRPDSPLKVLPKQPGEFVCQSCFLVKHPSQLADRDAMLCRDCV